VERQPREIEIFDIELLSFENDVIEFSARVSKGTYIRTLGEEIAVALHTLGHLISLRRKAIGNFRVEDAEPLEKVAFERLISIRKALSHLPVFEVDEASIKDIMNGKPVKLPEIGQIVLLVSDEKALALYEKRDDGLYYSRRGLF
ncbi:MAG TPA: tRNA pseudouridine(55) synthase TruB, partial [Bacilli bacterium]|nr:tRNA pseudouridine(55) synthase TruB [Bacilli bacterium]